MRGELSSLAECISLLGELITHSETRWRWRTCRESEVISQDLPHLRHDLKPEVFHQTWGLQPFGQREKLRMSALT